MSVIERLPRRRAVIGAIPTVFIGAAAPSPASKPPAPTPLSVPEALRRRFPRIEASGLAWAPSLDRYLVVIDDTIDDKEDERRAPVLLTLGRAGRFDDRPLQIDGLDELDDAESICAAGRIGAAERFFLLTSHAPNRRGRVRASRRQLVDLRVERGRLRSAATVDLSEGDGGIPALLARMGITAPHFDAEAIAWHGGALHVGLKAPLDGSGSALLVRLGEPDRVFASSRLPTGLASIGRRARLTVGSDGAPVSEGFSDVVFRADGSALAAANAPKGGPADGGGALWSIPAAAHAKPQLLAQFPGLKPEGLSPTPDASAFVVVFDRGDAAPWWTTWPSRA